MVFIIELLLLKKLHREHRVYPLYIYLEQTNLFPDHLNSTGEKRQQNCKNCLNLYREILWETGYHP